MLLPLLLTLTASEIPIYVGTYTSEHGSRGIYRVTMDSGTGRFSTPVLAATATSPSFIAMHPSGHYLYAVNENSSGDILSFSVQSDGSLSPLNTALWKGGGPCHVSVDARGKWVFAAAYGGGSFAAFPVQPDGSLGLVSSTFQNSGHGPDAQRQEGPHAHFIAPTPDGAFVYCCDLGTDEILGFRMDAGKLTPLAPPLVKTAPGSGPRHLAMDPKGSRLFATNELDCTVVPYDIYSSGELMPGGTRRSTLPPGASRKGVSTAEIQCHPSGKWVYVSNRGHDSIAQFSISKKGQLELVEIKPAGVQIPRSFAIDPTGKWMVVAGQNSNDLVSFAIGKDGRLEPTGFHATVNSPVCVLYR